MQLTTCHLTLRSTLLSNPSHSKRGCQRREQQQQQQQQEQKPPTFPVLLQLDGLVRRRPRNHRSRAMSASSSNSSRGSRGSRAPSLPPIQEDHVAAAVGQSVVQL
mmetsp:Transcript_2555/g.4823  ORF Transcript_2555/g.4823 Transcript_2555/m.4823 type:complete len:105 (-) Transcript_2555:235-549(-)